MIAIVGDAMIDSDLHLARVKTMDGVEVYRVARKSFRPGGASNVAEMCITLAREVLLLSYGVSAKTRYFLDSECLHRIDDDSRDIADEDVAAEWFEKLSKRPPNIIVVCDHAKGVITKPVMDMLKSTGAEIFVDPCHRSDWSLFAGVNCISANRDEWAASPAGSDQLAAMSIRRMDCDGVYWNDQHICSICEYPVDTVGAGDQFISVLACMRESGYPWRDAIEMANIAAGLQCERSGIVPVTWNEMYSRLGMASASK